MPWGSPKLYVIAVISFHVVWGWAVTQPEPMAMLSHKSNYNTTIQCSFLEGIKPLRDHPHWILLLWGSGGHNSNHSHKTLHWGLGQGFFFKGEGGSRSQYLKGEADAPVKDTVFNATPYMTNTGFAGILRKLPVLSWYLFGTFWKSSDLQPSFTLPKNHEIHCLYKNPRLKIPTMH